MTTQEQKALELALDALKSIKWVNSFNEGDYLTCNFKSVETSITAIKEALAQPEHEWLRGECVKCGQSIKRQEPVAWSYWQSCLNDDGTQTAPWLHRLSKFKPTESVINKDVTPLYTTPPQRTWVGLMDEEIWQTVTDCTIGGDLHADKFAKAIEAKLRSKNNA